MPNRKDFLATFSHPGLRKRRPVYKMVVKAASGQLMAVVGVPVSVDQTRAALVPAVAV